MRFTTKLEKLYKLSNGIPNEEIISELIKITLFKTDDTNRGEITKSKLFDEIETLNSAYSKISLKWFGDFISNAISKTKNISIEREIIKINRVDDKIVLKIKEYGVYFYAKEDENLQALTRATMILVKIGKANNMSQRVKQQSQTYGACPKILFKIHTENENCAKNLEALFHNIGKLKCRNIEMPNGAREWFRFSIDELYFLIEHIIMRGLNFNCKLEDCYMKHTLHKF